MLPISHTPYKVQDSMQGVGFGTMFGVKVAFFLNLHNARMLHSHIHRGSLDG